MPSTISINTSDVDRLWDAINRLQYEGMEKPIKEAVKKLVDKLKENVALGNEPRGGIYPHVRSVTMDMEIKRDGVYADPRIRSSVSTNPVAMNVTGKSREAIDSARVNYREYNVGYDSDRADIVFKSNAREHGNSPKPKRDPLGLTLNIATEEEFELVASEVEQAIDEALSGI